MNPLAKAFLVMWYAIVLLIGLSMMSVPLGQEKAHTDVLRVVEFVLVAFALLPALFV